MQLRRLTIGQYLKLTAARWPERTALLQSCTGRRLSWAELDQTTDRLAGRLLDLGLAKGDRIVIWLGNSIEWCLSYLAAAKIGVMVSALNNHCVAGEARTALSLVEAKAIVYSDGPRDLSHASVVQEIRAGKSPEHGEFGQLHLFIYAGVSEAERALRFNDLLAPLAGVTVMPPDLGLDPDDVINIQFTSGTTRRPKGVMLSHHQLVNNTWTVGHQLGLAETDILCLPIPLSHSFGTCAGLMACIGAGTALVLVDAHRVGDIVNAIETYRCTALHGVPTLFGRLLEYERLAESDISSLRTGLVAGANCPEAILRGIVERLGMRELAVGYGQTETSPGCTQTATDDTLELKLSTVGRPLPFVEMRVVDPLSGRLCDDGQSGEIQTRGYHVMKGYFRAPDETAAVMTADGWYRTGDLGMRRPDGRYCHRGRIKDIIIRGGENISPAEVEAAISTCAGVRDVRVFGIPSSKYGEDVAAALRIDAGQCLSADDIRQQLSQQIAWCKIPKAICFVEEFPLTASGKINVEALRKHLLSVAPALGELPEQQA